MAELQPLDLIDFTGGLNVRRTEFNLGENESPDMLNVEIDPRGGIFTRNGWSRFNDADIIADPGLWNPRSCAIAVDSSGAFTVLISNGTSVYEVDEAGDTVATSIVCGGSSHLADFSEWGDVVYVAAGLANPSIRRVAGDPGVSTSLGRAYNDDYTTPTDGNMPRAEHVEAHGGYLFCAAIDEVLDINDTGSGTQRNRVRWSHPSKPEDWATNDYIDIEVGGGTITGLKSFRDHLLIFKTDSIWALYGYASASFQLIKVSRSVGVPTPSAISSSETAVYFFSASQRGGIYAYDGGAPVELSGNILEILETVSTSRYTDVWLGWAGRKLWCSLPYDESGATDVQSVFVFDPSVGNGSWVRHKGHVGNLTCIIEGSDIEAQHPLGVVDGTTGTSAIVRLDYIDQAYDSILKVEDYALRLSDKDGFNLIVNGVDDPPTYLSVSADFLQGEGFDTLYRTRWLHGGWPERKKSWRRPRFAVAEQNQSVMVDVKTNWNYTQGAPRRQHVLGVTPEGTVFWRAGGAADPGGFDWGDGSLWGSSETGGSELERSQPSGAEGLGGLGVARSVQLEFSTSALTPAKKWGINAMFLKYKTRRYTT
jgi:hypothetical protein